MKWVQEAEKGPKGTGFHISDKCNHKSPAPPVNKHLNQPAAADATRKAPKRKMSEKGKKETDDIKKGNNMD